MKRMKQLLAFALIALGLAACTSQAKRTHQAFENPEADYYLLQEALNDLYIYLEDGGTVEQHKAVKALRHISQHLEEPGKREMGVAGLTVLAAYGSDNQAEDLAESRLDDLYHNGSLHMQLAVVRAKRDLVMGDLRIVQRETSLFSNDIDFTPQLADEDARANAVEFLVERFEDGEPVVQYEVAKAFGLILANNRRCYDWKKAESVDINKLRSEAKAAVDDANLKVSEAKAAMARFAPGAGAATEEGAAPVAGAAPLSEAQKAQEADKARRAADEAEKAAKKAKDRLAELEGRVVTTSGFYCTKWDAEDQEDWKIDLIEEMGEWVEDAEVPAETAVHLVLAIDGATGIKDASIRVKALKEISESNSLPEDRRGVLESAYIKARGQYPDIFTASAKQQAAAAEKKEEANKWTQMDDVTRAKMLENERNREILSTQVKLDESSFVRNSEYASLTRFSQRSFWINNAEPILNNQLFATRNSEVKEVPVGWLFYPGYDNSPTAQELKEILYFHSLKGLEKGYVISGTRSLAGMLVSSLDLPEDINQVETTRRLLLISYSFKSLSQNREEVKPLLDKLVQQGVEKQDLYEKRLYLLALAGAAEFYPKETEERLCPILKQEDVLTNHLARERVRMFAAANPFVTPEGKVNRNAKPGEQGPQFCGAPLYHNPVPQVTALAAVPAPPAPEKAAAATPDEAQTETNETPAEAAEQPKN